MAHRRIVLEEELRDIEAEAARVKPAMLHWAELIKRAELLRRELAALSGEAPPEPPAPERRRGASRALAIAGVVLALLGVTGIALRARARPFEGPRSSFSPHGEETQPFEVAPGGERDRVGWSSAMPVPLGADEWVHRGGYARTGFGAPVYLPGVNEIVVERGGLDLHAVQRMILSHRKEIGACALRRPSPADVQGAMRVTFTIGADGATGDVSALQSTLADGGETEGCVLGVLRGYRFPPYSVPTKVSSVVYAFTLPEVDDVSPLGVVR